MDINWFPGHMAKTLRELKEAANRCDFLVEMCDARIPLSSRNPEFADLAAHKQRLILLSKADLADPTANTAWVDYFTDQGLLAASCNNNKRADVSKVKQVIIEANREVIERAKQRGRRVRPIRVMVVGIPNTGKSSLINKLTGRNSAKTANLPGVTRKLTWLRAASDLELLDSPGSLWPKLATNQEKICLALTGAIKDRLLPVDQVAGLGLLIMGQLYPQALEDKYGIRARFIEQEGLSVQTGLWALTELARNLKLLLPGDQPDLTRAANLFLTDLRSSKITRVSLEQVDKPFKLPEDL